jgi:hypothetical protein
MISQISPSGEWATESAGYPIAATSPSGGLNNSVVPMQPHALEGAEWGKLIRDVAAIANSGGGCLDLPAASSVCSIGDLGVKKIVAHLAQYTVSTFDDLQLVKSKRRTPDLWKLEVGPAEYPIGFKQSLEDASAETSMSEGPFGADAFYFWHDGKSTLATSADFQAFLERRLKDARQQWSKQIGRVLSRPLRPLRRKRRAQPRAKHSAGASSNNLQPVRIVNDANAPVLQPQHVDQLYPWRQKDIVADINRRLGRRAVTTYDLQAVRRQHRLDESPDFVFHLPGAGRRYSPAAAEWMLSQYATNPEFFHQAHLADQSMLRQRRKKPR